MLDLVLQQGRAPLYGNRKEMVKWDEFGRRERVGNGAETSRVVVSLEG